MSGSEPADTGRAIPVTVGFIGLGRMGLPMARRLAVSDIPVTVWNRTVSRADALVAVGARRAGSPRELAAASDVVITMLADGNAARTVLCGATGVLSACRSGSVVVDMSTMGPQVAREIAAEAAAHGVEFLDAPVSGSVALAEQGTLTTMVGGSPDAFERARPVLEVLTKAQFHLGAAGAGAAMKLAVNIVVAATNQSVAEGLALAEKSGIDRVAAYETLASSAVASPLISYKREAYLNPESAPVSFAAVLMRKDLDLAIAAAGEARLPLPAAAAAKDFLDVACQAGLGDADFACVAQVLRHWPPT